MKHEHEALPHVQRNQIVHQAHSTLRCISKRSTLSKDTAHNITCIDADNANMNKLANTNWDMHPHRITAISHKDQPSLFFLSCSTENSSLLAYRQINTHVQVD